MYNILICDDDRDIVNALKIYLTDPDHRLFDASDGAEALSVIEKEDIHLVLMDIMMPVMDGISAMVKLRERTNVPVILITAKSEESDIILGLNVGADDYITKPFNPVEVSARVRSCLRRYMQLGSGKQKPETLTVGSIELCDTTKTVTVDGDAVSLTPTEYEILKLLMSDPGRVYSPKEIYRSIWRENPLTADNTIAVHVRHLREKIEITPAEPRYLKAVWGHGYMIQG
ncbi:MAG: response regulator transcription factor [Ruminococcaceae bacterium]|nr:response regulator transcription factor [Oscillospiraceae bacterium]